MRAAIQLTLKAYDWCAYCLPPPTNSEVCYPRLAVPLLQPYTLEEMVQILAIRAQVRTALYCPVLKCIVALHRRAPAVCTRQESGL